jgi:hypothetical protein
MKVYKIELMVIDFENLGIKEIKDMLENVEYISPTVISTDDRDIGKCRDDHPLNLKDKSIETFKELFSKPKLKFKDIEIGDCCMKMEEWISDVKAGGYIDDDGWGNLATSTKVSNRSFSPSDVGNEIPEWATHIVWYNR